MEDKVKDLDALIVEKKKLWEEINSTDEGWEKPEEKEGLIITKKPYKDTGLKFVRAKTTIKATPKAIHDVILDESKTLEIDVNIEKNEKVKAPEGYDIIYTIAKKPAMMVDRRDSITAMKTEEKDGGLLLIGGSIEHPDFPAKDSPVRCEVLLWSWYIVPSKDDPNVSEVTYIVHIDPKGWIPNAVTNAVSNDQAMNVKRVKDILEGT
mmetsp:Transcript_3803/g.3251  ORF Transcript_3803/g.3251 Transcript_3803/m.3251 type:complete len:208 (-) Transcript_3803:253-876(-)|eukprot:CAMPEP_0114589756 /NCGR_PEP_ID=MMETSP0125-20121206/12140_1 /TAXON_ID=485358 ORGANISM="Aristerostoma sp., Strain ATCC 50986" /NCGR_SAMPLE_ID=MMETSP0125 /ASSEMBLY_ACC=CAM_ASM_000245 /LENGTH=207 /DNA_ID=CAMNT_0001786833 /DNA_START=27 /DNA_END=650 /DNA_ORIENTATION=+